MVRRSNLVRAAVMCTAVSGVTAWASMAEQHLSQTGSPAGAPGLAPGAAPGAAPGMAPGPAPGMSPGPAPGPSAAPMELSTSQIDLIEVVKAEADEVAAKICDAPSLPPAKVKKAEILTKATIEQLPVVVVSGSVPEAFDEVDACASVFAEMGVSPGDADCSMNEEKVVQVIVPEEIFHPDPVYTVMPVYEEPIGGPGSVWNPPEPEPVMEIAPPPSFAVWEEPALDLLKEMAELESLMAELEELDHRAKTMEKTVNAVVSQVMPPDEPPAAVLESAKAACDVAVLDVIASEVDPAQREAVSLLAAAVKSGKPVVKIGATLQASTPDDACAKTWAALGLDSDSGTCNAQAEGKRRRGLLASKFATSVLINPAKVDCDAIAKATEAIKSAPGVEAEVKIVAPAQLLKEIPSVSTKLVEALEAKAAIVEVVKTAVIKEKVAAAPAPSPAAAYDMYGAGPGMAPGPAPAVDPYAIPEFPEEEPANEIIAVKPAPTIFENPASHEPEIECKDYTTNANGEMVYGPIPCPTPGYLTTPDANGVPQVVLDPVQQKQVEEVQEAGEAAVRKVVASDDHEEQKSAVKLLAEAVLHKKPVRELIVELPMLVAQKAEPTYESAVIEETPGMMTGGPCEYAWTQMGMTITSGTCTPFIPHAEELIEDEYEIPTKFVLDFDPMVIAPEEAEAAIKKANDAPDSDIVVAESKIVDPAEELHKNPSVSDAAVDELEEQAISYAEIQAELPIPEPMTTPPNVVGAALTGCYELDSSPPEGYVHAESNLEFNADRSDQAAVIYEVNSEKFTSLTCSEAPTHHFQASDYCKGTDKCDEVCHTNMPPKCNATASSFGVCAPTVDQICAHMQTSKDSCALASQKVIDATISYNHLDVQSSPCVSAVHRVTNDAHDAYRAAYDEWVYAYNNASHACKIGSAIRDYNGMAFVQHHQNMDNIQKVAEMVCNEEEFDPNEVLAQPGEAVAEEAALGDAPNKETCNNIQQLIAEIKSDTDLASRQIQCFASECVNSKSMEAYKYQELQLKYSEYAASLEEYKTAVETYNDAVADKYLKKAAAEEAFDVFNPHKEDMTTKFHKDLEVYMSFASGAAEGNCGLTDCEMTAVCAHEIEAKFETYVDHSDRGCVRHDSLDTELCTDGIDFHVPIA